MRRTLSILLHLTLAYPLLLAAQDTPLPKFPDREQTRVEAACQRLIEHYLTTPATTGDIRSACRCMQTAFDAARLPPDRYLKDYGYGEVLVLERISYWGNHELAVKELFPKVDVCLANVDLANGYFDADREPSETIVRPTPGPARERPTGEGSLRRTNTSTLDLAMTKIMAERFGFSAPGLSYAQRQQVNDTMRPLRDAFREELLQHAPREVLDYPVLSCGYDVGSTGAISREYFNWHPLYPPSQEILSRLSKDHPIHDIGTDPNGCASWRPKQ